MHIILLTHQREIGKTTNTGRLVIDSLGKQAKVVIWDRVNPDPELLRLIEQGSIALIYPTDDCRVPSESGSFDTYILIDGTWQEARKIYNKSPYLKALPKILLKPEQASKYHLRRNQKVDGLCTAECAIAILKSENQSSAATDLELRLTTFLSL